MLHVTSIVCHVSI